MKKYVEDRDTTSIEMIEVVGGSATEEKKVRSALSHAMYAVSINGLECATLWQSPHSPMLSVKLERNGHYFSIII